MRNVSSPESWAYLSRVVEGPSIHIQEFITNGRSADEIAHGVRTRASWIGALGPQTQNRSSVSIRTMIENVP